MSVVVMLIWGEGRVKEKFHKWVELSVHGDWCIDAPKVVNIVSVTAQRFMPAGLDGIR